MNFYVSAFVGFIIKVILLIISINSTYFGRYFRPFLRALDWSPAGSIVGALYHKLQTQFSAPEGGRNYRPKYVELIEIINKIFIVASSWLFILLDQ